MVLRPDPRGCSVKFIILVDDPASPEIDGVLALQSARERVRVNSKNVGASALRNRGLDEACAEYVLFWDDDVDVAPDCLSAYAAAVRNDKGRSAGFVGTTVLPQTRSVLHEGTRLSDITFFYALPETLGDGRAFAPWGVTANLLVKRSRRGHVAPSFGLDFAKTGGGEDIDFCIQQVQCSGRAFSRVAGAVVTHEWWDASNPLKYVLRFWAWTCGDGYLNYKHPQHVYLNFPNMIELTAILLAAAATVVAAAPSLAVALKRLTVCLNLAAGLWAVEVA
ncbi:nucleotide-diphospho-sugar transferase [Pelagophyceae sp. CCMP2097]|nr:nucleotide-diphospho-sugar transferase [Pelagophyceae sp. CCMP2097]